MNLPEFNLLVFACCEFLNPMYLPILFLTKFKLKLHILRPCNWINSVLTRVSISLLEIVILLGIYMTRKVSMSNRKVVYHMFYSIWHVHTTPNRCVTRQVEWMNITLLFFLAKGRYISPDIDQLIHITSVDRLF